MLHFISIILGTIQCKMSRMQSQKYIHIHIRHSSYIIIYHQFLLSIYFLYESINYVTWLKTGR